MKKVFYLLIIIILISCSRDWNNPLETDEELKNKPNITQIEVNSDYGFLLHLDRSYSDDAQMMFEKKIVTAYEPITLKKITASSFADTTINLELNYQVQYRLQIEKDGYYSEISDVFEQNYTSNFIYEPEDFFAVTLEGQGINLTWTDKSSKEAGFKLEKNENGAGFVEIADLPANTENYFDPMADPNPDPPINLEYRIKTYNSTFSSNWEELQTQYSGIGSPTNLTIIDSSYYHFTIQWNDNSNIETGYSVERKMDEGSFNEVELLPINSTTYEDALSDSGTYFYRVRAEKNDLYSGYSNEVSILVEFTIPTEGLVAYYPFNGNANDESGNGNDGTNYGATITTDRFGNENSAFSYDGSDFVDIGIIAESYTIWSFCFWAYKDGTDLTKYIADKNGAGYYFGVESNEWRFKSNTASTILADNNTWTHICYTYDDSNIRIYKNSESPYIQAENLDSTFPVRYLGDYEATGDWKGKIDEVRIYNRPLSEPEIQSLYHEGGWRK